MRISSVLRSLIFLVLLGSAAPLFAHPHMSLVASCEFVWKDDTLSGVHIDWAFDPYFSADIIRGFDSNGDGKFDRTKHRRSMTTLSKTSRTTTFLPLYVRVRGGRTRHL
jgi:ABC-type uncharacterized transport system substrate-binding protein